MRKQRPRARTALSNALADNITYNYSEIKPPRPFCLTEQESLHHDPDALQVFTFQKIQLILLGARYDKMLIL